MATCLIAWELGAGTGHCVKLLPIAQGLLSNGHRVFVAGRDLTSVRRIFGPMGVEFLQAPFLVPRPTSPMELPRCFAHILHNTGFGDEQQLEPLLMAWRNLIKLVSPDMIVCEHSPMALLASRFVNICRVVIGTGFSVPPDVWPPPDFRPWLPPASDKLQADELAIVERINRLLVAEGHARIERLGQLYSQVDASFLVTFAELDHHGQRPTATYWGVWSPSGGISGEWGTERGPKLFAYLKPPSPMWRVETVLEILLEFRVNSLIYMPGVESIWLKRFQAPQLRFVSQRLDIRKVARQCDLAVLNGTAGTASELLLHGVPQLNIPMFLEQVLLSRRIEEIGAGLVAAPKQPDQIRAQLVEVLQNPRYRIAAKAFSKRYAKFDAQESIASAVGQIVALLR